MRVFLEICKTQKVDFIKLKYSIPKEARNGTNLLGVYETHIFGQIGYVDDLVIACSDNQNLQIGLNILQSVFTRFGLAMNVGKIKTMIMNYYNGEPELYPSCIVKVDGEDVKVFKYLGNQLHYGQHTTGDTEITTRIDMTESKYNEYAKKLMNFKIKLSTCISIINSLVHSRLTNGCQTWILSSA